MCAHLEAHKLYPEHLEVQSCALPFNTLAQHQASPTPGLCQDLEQPVQGCWLWRPAARSGSASGSKLSPALFSEMFFPLKSYMV